MDARSDTLAFRARPPWWGGDLQTLRGSLAYRSRPLPGRSERLRLALADGSGDRLAAMLDRPATARPGPLIVLVHGLTGSEESPYVTASAAFHLRRGRRVLRLNLRGAGPSRQSCAGHYHAGCARDVHDALAALDRRLLADGVVVIGYSLGGNVALNLLAGHRLPIRAAVIVSAPIEPAEAARRFMAPRNALYHRWLLARMKRESMAPGARLADAERLAIRRARSIYEFDDRFVAPRHGFSGAEDYYARTAGARKVGAIGVPTLLIHARDDPWVPAAAYESLRPRCPAEVRLLLTPRGGHVGFHAQGCAEPWLDLVANNFVTSIIGP